jgi:hypothetical protein
MVKAAREPQRHGVFKRKSWPMRNAMPAPGVPLHQRKLRLDDSGCHWRSVAAAMFGLHFYAFRHAAIIHHTSAKFRRLDRFCHIALSARGP